MDMFHKQMAALYIDGYFDLKVPYEVLASRVVERGQPGDSKWSHPEAFAAHEAIIDQVWSMEEIDKVTDIDGTVPTAAVVDAILAALPPGLFLPREPQFNLY